MHPLLILIVFPTKFIDFLINLSILGQKGLSDTYHAINLNYCINKLHLTDRETIDQLFVF